MSPGRRHAGGFVIAARVAALISGSLILALVLETQVALAGLGLPSTLGAVMVIGGLPAAWLFVAALPRPVWAAAAAVTVIGPTVLLALASAPRTPWPTDVRVAGPVALALCGGFVGIVGGLTAVLAILRARTPACWRVATCAVATLFAVVSVARVMGKLRDDGLLPFAQGGRLASYDRLWRNLERYYVRWDRAAVPLDDLRARYRARVAVADAGCGYFDRCEPYRRAVRDMLAELRDGHTWAYVDDGLALPPLTIEPIDGLPVIRRGAGLIPGTIVVAVDGRPVAEAIREVPSHLVAFSAARTRDRRRVAQSLIGPAGTSVRIEFEAPDGARGAIELLRSASRWGIPSSVSSRLVDGEVGYITVSHLTNADVVAAFDRAIDALRGVRGLVIDLRGNTGGNSTYGDAIVGRLLASRITYAEECTRAAHPLRRVAGCYALDVAPRGTAYSGPVAVLIDGDVASSAERMTLALCGTGRARCFGTTTAGNSGNPVVHFLPDLTVQFSTGETYVADGRTLDGNGVTPAVEAPWTRAALAAGRDPALESALEWLRSR